MSRKGTVMPGQSTALVITGRPARYGKQLVAHLSRRNGGEWSDADHRGWIELGDGRAEVEATSDGLALTIHTEDGDLSRLEDVVGRHLARFGARDELRVQWSRQDGTPGTFQQG